MKGVFLVLFVAALVGACDWGTEADTGAGNVSDEPTTSAPEEPTVQSSLEGLTVLPARIAWSATTSLPPAQVKMVQFRVDGDRWWDDTTPPYAYGPPGAYLVARWVSSLRTRPSFRRRRTHEFAVRVLTTDGDKWESATVRARSPSATHARLPGGLGGQYGPDEYVRLSPAELAHPLPPTKLPSFAHFLVFIGSSLFVRGDKHDAAWEISGSDEHVRLGTPIFLTEATHADATSNFRGIEDVLCAPGGPPATYSWSEARGRPLAPFWGGGGYARNLQLRAVKDPCKERRRLLEGVWEGIVAG
jgi:hypothetical protein